jgi:transposase
MTTLDARARGDLAEELLPTAASLVTIVHGDGGPDDLGNLIGRLDTVQKDALLVLLASMVDPDRALSDAFAWLQFDEYGRPASAPFRGEWTRIRDLAVELEEPEAATELIDEVAVAAYAEGRNVAVTDEERLRAVVRCVEGGMSYQDIDRHRNLKLGDTSLFLNRMRRQYEREGREFPAMERPNEPRVFTEDEVVEIRTRSAAGATDLELAMSFGTEAGVIGHICRGRRHPEFGGPIRKPKRGPSKNTRTYWLGDGDTADYAKAS